jgi:hypothetical protein
LRYLLGRARAGPHARCLLQPLARPAPEPRSVCLLPRAAWTPGAAARLPAPRTAPPEPKSLPSRYLLRAANPLLAYSLASARASQPNRLSPPSRGLPPLDRSLSEPLRCAPAWPQHRLPLGPRPLACAPPPPLGPPARLGCLLWPRRAPLARLPPRTPHQCQLAQRRPKLLDPELHRVEERGGMEPGGDRNGRKMKRPPIREDLKVLIYQSQEADNTFITTDGTSPYNSSR